MWGRALALACALAAAGAGSAAPAPAAAPPPARLDGALVSSPGFVALDTLRRRDPVAFIAAVETQRAKPAPVSRDERETLALMTAHAEHLQGRTAAGIALAEALAHDAEDPDLRFVARVLVVNLLAFSRDFERMLRTLGPLLDEAANGRLRPAQQAHLHLTATVLYNELGHAALAQEHADRLLATSTDARHVCYATINALGARVAGHDPRLGLAEFEAGLRQCRDSGDAFGAPALGVIKARFLARSQGPEAALAVLTADAAAREATGYRWLMADGASLGASLLLALDRDAEAAAEARRAVEWSTDLPSSRPMAVAQEVLYRLALRRGDTAAALRHLEAAMQAESLDEAEDRAKEAALLVVQHEARQQKQALLLAQEQARVLAQAEANAAAAHRHALLLAAMLGLVLLLVLGWGLRVLWEERRYRRLARHDELTGFANRAGFIEEAARRLRRAQGRRQPIALIVFDLDLFKQINDRHGHLAGDAVLRAVAAALRGLPMRDRLVGRIGGEEFALLLPGVTPAEARGHAEACRLAIANAEALHEGVPLRVTASFGVARADLLPAGLAELLARADRALYRAKHDGRNRIVENEEHETEQA